MPRKIVIKYDYLQSFIYLLYLHFLHFQSPKILLKSLILCQKHRFCGKEGLNNFYPMVRSMLSSLIHIDVKRISQTYHTWKTRQNFEKHNFRRKYKIGRFFGQTCT